VEYLLVLPVPGSTIRGHDEVIHLEERVSAALGDTGKVDGHQSGGGETNVLILTRNPFEAYDVLRGLDLDARPELRAVYRQIDDADYEVFYGGGSYRFHITEATA
jgi:hypothetical protein